MFEGWSNFYFLLGSASASLIGLMFVVTTLTRSGDRAKAQRGQRLFMTPTVFNFAAVLALSALALTPRLAPEAHRIGLGAVGAYGLGYAIIVLVQHLKAGSGLHVDWTDPVCYGVLPALAYLGFETALFSTAIIRDAACDFVALSLLALLLVAVRNAWDLVTWIAPMSGVRLPPDA